MPHFRWRGVTIEGKWCRGSSCAVSQEQLDARLFSRGIACTQVISARPYILRPTVSRIDQAQGLQTLALLLDAGVKMPEACIVTAETLANPVLQEFFISLALSLERGKEFGDGAMSGVFNPLVVHLMQVGYNAGTLTKILPLCATFLQSADDTYTRMRSALLMPLLTLFFVLVLLWAIFVFLVPSLTALFSQLNADLPATTQALLFLSAWLSNPVIVCVGLLGITCIGFMSYFLHQRGFLVRMYAALPVLGSLYMQWHRIVFMRSLAALLDGGVRISEALQVLVRLTPSVYMRRYVEHLAHEVAGGMQLSDALASGDSALATPLMIALVFVGQESNTLAKTLTAAAQRESVLFLGTLQTITLVVQPILILGLGLVVLMIIASVYMPLISIAHVV